MPRNPAFIFNRQDQPAVQNALSCHGGVHVSASSDLLFQVGAEPIDRRNFFQSVHINNITLGFDGNA